MINEKIKAIPEESSNYFKDMEDFFYSECARHSYLANMMTFEEYTVVVFTEQLGLDISDTANLNSNIDKIIFDTCNIIPISQAAGILDQVLTGVTNLPFFRKLDNKIYNETKKSLEETGEKIVPLKVFRVLYFIQQNELKLYDAGKGSKYNGVYKEEFDKLINDIKVSQLTLIQRLKDKMRLLAQKLT